MYNNYRVRGNYHNLIYNLVIVFKCALNSQRRR
jgi:hypothetical protein